MALLYKYDFGHMVAAADVNIWFSYEAHFWIRFEWTRVSCWRSGCLWNLWLNGYINKNNCRIWSDDNPQAIVKAALHPKKLTVWSTLRARGITGPYVFINNKGQNGTVIGERYRDRLTKFVVPKALFT